MMLSFLAVQLPVDGLDILVMEARAEGFHFVDRLLAEWESGANRFAMPDECLLGCFDDKSLVAIGGLNRDPYKTDPRVGRLRHLYVRSNWRRRGIGSKMADRILDAAKGSFEEVRLRTDTIDAARFYEAHGFLPIQDASASHTLSLRDRCPV